MIVPMRYRAMGRAIAGKPSIAQTRREKRLKKARILRAQRRKNKVPVAAVAVPVAEAGAGGAGGESKFGSFENEDAYYFEYYRRLEEEEEGEEGRGEQVGGEGEGEGKETRTDTYYSSSEAESDENDGVGDEFDLALDIAHQFLTGNEWSNDILNFVEQRCQNQVFVPRDMEEGKFDHDHHQIWCEFRTMAEKKIETLLEQLGLSTDTLVRRCRRVLRTRGDRHRRHASQVVRALLVIDDFAAFCRLVLDIQVKEEVSSSMTTTLREEETEQEKEEEEKEEKEADEFRGERRRSRRFEKDEYRDENKEEDTGVPSAPPLDAVDRSKRTDTASSKSSSSSS